jgi:hypothetical protein
MNFGSTHRNQERLNWYFQITKSNKRNSIEAIALLLNAKQLALYTLNKKLVCGLLAPVIKNCVFDRSCLVDALPESGLLFNK